MIWDVRRIDWINPAQPVSGPRIDWTRIDTVVLHYTAAANVPDGDGDPDTVTESPEYLFRYIRAVQNDYLTNPNRGYSIGYNAAVDAWERRWELRGDDIKSAANRDHNEHTFTILVLVDGAKPASKKMVRAIRDLIVQAETLAQRGLKVLGHDQLQNPHHSTGCPGAGILKQIAERFFDVDVPLQEYVVDQNGDYIVDENGNFLVEISVPTPVPPVVVKDDKVLIIVGIDENHSDPHRYLSDGLSCRWIQSEAEFDRVKRYFNLHPDANTLQNPAWWPRASIRAMGGEGA